MGDKFDEFLKLFGVDTTDFVNMEVTGFNNDGKDTRGVYTLLKISRARDPFSDQETVNAEVAEQNRKDGYNENGEKTE